MFSGIISYINTGWNISIIYVPNNMFTAEAQNCKTYN